MRIPFSRAAADAVVPLGVHAGLWTADWSPASADAAITGSARAGFDLIEIPLADPRSTDLDHTRRLLEQHGLDAVVSLALGPASDITSPDPDVVARGEQLLLDAATMAEAIGAGYIGGVTYSAMTRYPAPATAAGRASSQAVLRRVAAAADARGILLGVEYVNRYESNLLNTAAQTAAFIEELGASNVLLHLDTFHAHSEELSLPAAVADAGGHLGYIHAGESHRGRIGTGTIDWPGFVAALAATGYRGPLTFESFSPDVVSPAAVNEIGLWRSPWRDPAEVAAEAAVFLRGLLAASTPSTISSTR